MTVQPKQISSPFCTGAKVCFGFLLWKLLTSCKTSSNVPIREALHKVELAKETLKWPHSQDAMISRTCVHVLAFAQQFWARFLKGRLALIQDTNFGPFLYFTFLDIAKSNILCYHYCMSE